MANRITAQMELADLESIKETNEKEVGGNGGKQGKIQVGTGGATDTDKWMV